MGSEKQLLGSGKDRFDELEMQIIYSLETVRLSVGPCKGARRMKRTTLTGQPINCFPVLYEDAIAILFVAGAEAFGTLTDRTPFLKVALTLS